MRLQDMKDFGYDFWDTLVEASGWRSLAYRTDPRFSILNDYEHALITPRRSALSSRKDVNLTRSFTFKHAARETPLKTTPIIGANMDGIGTFKAAKAAISAAENYQAETGVQEAPISVALRKQYTAQELFEFHEMNGPTGSWMTLGVKEADFEKLSEVMNLVARIGSSKQSIDKVCIDTPNGYSVNQLPPMIERVRADFPDLIIMAGNVVDKDGVRMLDDAGADIVKVGIGPGSVCTTRHMTGVGCPQLSAVIGCAREADRRGIHVCADGGCTSPGDFAKALVAGAGFVMAGGILSGIEDSQEDGAEIYEKDGQRWVRFYGSSSEIAMNKNNGGVAAHRSSEGKVVERPIKGSMQAILYGNDGLLGGIRSAMTYINATKPQEAKDLGKLAVVHKQINTVFGPPSCG